MGSYIIRRLLICIPVLFGITVISFLMIHLAPGSPIGSKLNPKVTPQTRERWNKNFHLDKPLFVNWSSLRKGKLRAALGETQYFLWIRDLVTLKLKSFKDGRPVLTRIAERLPYTIYLNLVQVIIIFSLAIPVGIFSAVRRYSLADHTLTLLAFMGISLPSFWVAYLLIFFVVGTLGLPVLGASTFGLVPLPSVATIADRIWHLTLPAIVGAIGGIAGLSRYMRGSMLEVMQQDYIRTARAKGLTENDVTYRHGLKNALLPFITIFGFLIPSLIGGSVIIESIFAWPGIGRLAYDSVLSRDYPTIMTITTISAVLVLIGNLVADVLYAVVDPRIRYQ
ncbi:MAG: ABC transporter permease [Planctomycetes bacterium]|nr:ABC transporter permease [Planctomycetota bacterium]